MWILRNFLHTSTKKANKNRRVERRTFAVRVRTHWLFEMKNFRKNITSTVSQWRVSCAHTRKNSYVQSCMHTHTCTHGCNSTTTPHILRSGPCQKNSQDSHLPPHSLSARWALIYVNLEGCFRIPSYSFHYFYVVLAIQFFGL